MVVSVEIELENRHPSNAVRKAHKKYLQDSASKGSAVGQEHAPEDRGQLRQSRIDPEWRGSTLVWGWDAPYAAAQNEGTEGFYPPIDPLIEWSERQGMDKGFAFYVQEKIAEEGIEPKLFAQEGAKAQKRWLQSKDFGDYIDKFLD